MVGDRLFDNGALNLLVGGTPALISRNVVSSSGPMPARSLRDNFCNGTAC